VVFDAPGLDGSWFTEDDRIRGYELYAHDEAGRVTGLAHISGAGPDAVWMTDDDEPRDTGIRRVYDEFGQQVRMEEFHVGPDGRAFTEDDEITWAGTAVWRDGAVETEASANAPG